MLAIVFYSRMCIFNNEVGRLSINRIINSINIQSKRVVYNTTNRSTINDEIDEQAKYRPRNPIVAL